VITKRRVLVVDDDEDVRCSVARLLQVTGRFDVETAADGFEAGVKFQSCHPDLVILDAILPGMGGFDICERMRRTVDGRRVKIIVMTGYPGPGASERTLLSGADLLLTKPQSAHDLVAHVTDLLDG
jgi:CheY-like chemotaxis protein